MEYEQIWKSHTTCILCHIVCMLPVRWVHSKYGMNFENSFLCRKDEMSLKHGDGIEKVDINSILMMICSKMAWISLVSWNARWMENYEGKLAIQNDHTDQNGRIFQWRDLWLKRKCLIPVHLDSHCMVMNYLDHLLVKMELIRICHWYCS